MRKLPNFFYDQEIAIIESGEQTGMLQSSFLSISKDLRMQEELKNKIMGAMTYPIIILFFLVIAFCIVMIYVIPQLMPILASSTSELPWSTRSLIATSDFLRNNIFVLLVTFVAGGFMFQGYIRTESGKKWWDHAKLFFPLVGNVYKNYLIARTMSTFHLLTSSGVSIVRTLQLTGSSSGNKILEALFRTLADDISHGQKISSSMRTQDKNAEFFTPDILQMVESAEKTSTISSVTDKIAVQYRREVDVALGTMVKFIEPVALLLAGVFVLWFAISIFSAIMQVVSIAGN